MGSLIFERVALAGTSPRTLPASRWTSRGPEGGAATILLHGCPEFRFGRCNQIGPLGGSGLRPAR